MFRFITLPLIWYILSLQKASSPGMHLTPPSEHACGTFGWLACYPWISIVAWAMQSNLWHTSNVRWFTDACRGSAMQDSKKENDPYFWETLIPIIPYIIPVSISFSIFFSIWFSIIVGTGRKWFRLKLWGAVIPTPMLHVAHTNQLHQQAWVVWVCLKMRYLNPQSVSETQKRTGRCIHMAPLLPWEHNHVMHYSYFD